MIRALIAALLCILAATGVAAQNCAGLTNITNGTNADASQVMANFNTLLNCINNLPVPPAQPSVRQTVTNGPRASSTGLPNFLPGSTSDPSIGTNGISPSSPFVATAANYIDTATGFPRNRVGRETGPLSWGNLTANTTNYLYVTVETAGTLTPASTTKAPIYQWAGTASTDNGQFTFNISRMQGFMGNGATAPQAYIVFVGEAVTDTNSVTSALEYAYNGMYESAFASPLPVGQNTTANHNLGIQPGLKDFLIECTAADFGFAVGDRISLANGVATATTTPTMFLPVLRSTYKTMTITNLSQTPWFLLRPGLTAGGLTLGSWRYKFVAQRGW
jgi:hypothetical protein